MFFKNNLVVIMLTIGNLIGWSTVSLPATSISDPIGFIESIEKTALGTAVGSLTLESKKQVAQAYEFEQVLLVIIADIDASLNYWKNQYHHPNWYVFNKGPRGWVNALWYGKKYADEIQANITALETIERRHYKLLGRIVQALEKLSVVENDANMLSNRTKIMEATNYSWISDYQKAIFNEYASLRTPSHVQQHWVKYAAAGIGLAVIGGYIYSNKDRIAQMMSDIQAGIQKRYDENLAKPIKDFKDLIFNQDQQPELEPLPALNTKSIREKLAKEFSNFGAEQKKQIKKIFEMISKESDIDSTYKQSILTALERDDLALVSDLLGNIDAKNREKLSKEFGIFSALTSRHRLNKAITDTIQTGILHKIDLNVLVVTSWLKQFIGLLLFDTWTPLEGSLQVLHRDVERFRKEFAEIKTSQRMNLILSTLIPTLVVAGIGGYTVKKLISLLRTKKVRDFQPLREALLDISKLLNRYNNSASAPMPLEDSGRLAYLYAKSVWQVDSLMTGKQRDALLADIQESSRAGFTINQRLRVLDDIHKRYDFLQYQVKSV